jgi:hypothetical protein
MVAAITVVFQRPGRRSAEFRCDQLARGHAFDLSIRNAGGDPRFGESDDFNLGETTFLVRIGIGFRRRLLLFLIYFLEDLP